MMQSMTAYASAEQIETQRTVTVEIRSVNSRYLDIALKLHHEYAGLEKRIRSAVSRCLTRGRIDIRIQIERDDEGDAAFRIQEARAVALDNVLGELKRRYAWDIRLPFEFLSGAGGVVRSAREAVDLDALWPAVSPCLDRALAELVAMRKTEGGHIAADLAVRLHTIETQLAKIRENAEDLVPGFQQRLTERIGQLTNGMIDLDPNRLAQEAAFLADRSDISEEIVRVESHIRQFEQIMASGEPAGRKLNFLLQEFNREFNTMGSKVGDADIAHIIVAVKSEVEKIREQVQNIE